MSMLVIKRARQPTLHRHKKTMKALSTTTVIGCDGWCRVVPFSKPIPIDRTALKTTPDTKRIK